LRIPLVASAAGDATAEGRHTRSLVGGHRWEPICRVVLLKESEPGRPMPEPAREPSRDESPREEPISRDPTGHGVPNCGRLLAARLASASRSSMIVPVPRPSRALRMRGALAPWILLLSFWTGLGCQRARNGPAPAVPAGASPAAWTSVRIAEESGRPIIAEL